MIALIPGRGGSKRIPRKNIKLLGGYPLIAWTIAAAFESDIFEKVFVCTENAEIAMWCIEHTAAGVIQRSPESATDTAPDILWVREMLASEAAKGAESFAILRPTSPFRTVDMLQRAYKQFKGSEVHSIRAVEPAKQHPSKMWTWLGAGYPMTPVMAGKTDTAPWHSMPTQSLPEVYVQNASLEMAWTYVVNSFGTISGRKIAPFFTQGYEGFDINTEDDWREAERLIAEGLVELPRSYVASLSAATARL